MLVQKTKDKFLKSSIPPEHFGKAMAELDLSGVPKHRRQEAVMDHVAKIMAGTIHDREVAVELTAARLMRLNK